MRWIMFILSRSQNKKCSDKHIWRPKFKQGTNELFVVCAICNHTEKVSYYSDYQAQSVMEMFFK